MVTFLHGKDKARQLHLRELEIGDHGHHVHVFRDNKLVLKWDLDNEKAIEGEISRRIRELISDLKKEGQL